MEQKFNVNQMLTNKNNGYVERIYAVAQDGQPFDLLDISILTHYDIISIDALQEKFNEFGIEFTLEQTGRTYKLTLNSKESADRFIENIAPLFNEVLSE